MTSKSGNESVSLTGPVVGQGGTAGHLPNGYGLREFQVDRVLGEGGFSVVYLATDTRLERQVAIKEYMPTALATRNPDLSVHVRSSAQHREAFEAGLRSFINEAKLLARFEHRALVKVHQFWQDKGTAYMVMPYYSGPTLKSWIKQQRDPVDPAWLEQFLRLVMDALETLHKENCLHRDVAPDNILILNGRLPLLLDFGAARRVIGDLTQALTVILKPGFAPIEQYAESQSMRQGPWTDVYALCAVAHFMITGRAPTPSVTRVLADDLVPLSTAAEGRFPPAFLAALDAGLTVRPQQRPQSVGALRDLMNGGAPDDTLTAPPGARLAPIPGPVPATLRPLPQMAEPDGSDPDKTRIVTTRDLSPRTGSNTISSPDKPALASLEPETTPDLSGDSSFESRFPSRSMREHEAALAQAPEPEQDDRGSRLPLLLGAVAIAAVIGAAWALINWLNGEIAVSRRSEPAVSPAPTPKPSAGAVTSPSTLAAAPAQAPVIAPPPAPLATPAPVATPPTASQITAPAASQTEPTAVVPAAPKAEPIAIEKPATAETSTAKPAPPAPASEPQPASQSASDSKPPPASTAAPKSAPPPTQTAAMPVTPAPMKSAPPPTATEKRPSNSAAAAASKSGPPPSTETTRVRSPPAQPNPLYPSAPLAETPAAPAVSVPAVATVDAAVPPPLAAVEPPRTARPAAPMTELKAISKPGAMFPHEAVRAGVDKGRVTARLSVASDGLVSKVEILSAYPARLFDREVRETAMRWRYEAPGQPRQTDVEFVFDRFKER
jgi:TonB family protein